MLHLVVRFRHTCDLSAVSARHPEVPFAQWCNNRVDIVEVRPGADVDPEPLRADLRGLTDRGFRLLDDPDGDGAMHLVLTCGHGPYGDSVEDVIGRHGALALQPVLYHAGWETYRIVVPESGRAEVLMKALRAKGELKLVRKRRSQGQFHDGGMLLASGDILGELTERQAKALAVAVEAGYYEVPRRARFQDIADRAGQPRTTFEEHVRKAEAKVIRAVAPYLGTVTSRPGGTRRRTTLAASSGRGGATQPSDDEHGSATLS